MDSEFFKTFSVETFLTAFKNHWFPAGLVFGVTIVAAVLAMLFLPRTYGSGAMIFVKLGRETVSLDPTATTGSTISVLGTRDNEINSIRDMLYSRGIAEQVVDRIGADVILGDTPVTDEVNKTAKFEGKDYRNSPRQKAIRQLINDTYVISSRKSSVLTLNSKGSTPELAQKIVQEYLDVYQGMHTDAHQTPQSNSFFKEQSRLLRGQWKESMKALQIAKEDAGVVSIEGARENLKAQTNTIESNLMNVTNGLVSTEAKLAKYKFLVDKNPLDRSRLNQERIAAQGELSAMAAEKKALTGQLGELLDKAAKLNRDEVMIGQLQKAVELSAANYAQYQELYEQSRIEEALNSSQFTNVRIVQGASYVPKPLTPNKRLIIAAGVVAATSGAILTALLLELFWVPFRARRKDGSSDLETEVLKNNQFLTRSPIANG